MNIKSIVFFLLGIAFSFSSIWASEVNIYSSRQEFLMRPFLKQFEKETGIKVNVVYAKKGILERIKHEGRNTRADVVIMADIGNLTKLADSDLLQPYLSTIIDKNIPAPYRDSKGLWTGITSRGRVLFYSKERVKLSDLSTYENLTDPKWKGRICIRKGTHDYNLALVSSLIITNGENATQKWANGLYQNLARKPQGNDRAQVKAISEGICDVALVNTYYMGAMLEDPKQRSWADAAGIFFPNQAGRGTHINISGGGITKYAKNKENAKKLLAFLTDDLAQHLFAQSNHEYPLKKGIALSPIVKSFGVEQAGIPKGGVLWDTQELSKIGLLRIKAIKIMNHAGFK